MTPGDIDGEVRALLDAGRLDDATGLTLRRYGGEVLGYLRALHGDDDAADVLSATSERVWRGLNRFRWESSLRTWVYVIARRESLRFRDRARAQSIDLAPDSALDRVPASVRSETLSIFREEKREKLLSLRDSLPVEDREILILRVSRELSWDDIARTFLSDPEVTHESLVREAARLRKRYQALKEKLVAMGRKQGLLKSE